MTATLPEVVRLNLGCGDKILNGYLNVDVASERGGAVPDINCDVRNLEIFDSEFADEVLAVHVVEHFWRLEVWASCKSGCAKTRWAHGVGVPKPPLGLPNNN